MPGRIRAEDLDRKTRATLVGGAAHPAPVRTPPAVQDPSTRRAEPVDRVRLAAKTGPARPNQRCHTCHQLLASEAAAERHGDTPGHHIIETWIGEDW